MCVQGLLSVRSELVQLLGEVAELLRDSGLNLLRDLESVLLVNIGYWEALEGDAAADVPANHRDCAWLYQRIAEKLEDVTAHAKVCFQSRQPLCLDDIPTLMA